VPPVSHCYLWKRLNDLPKETELSHYTCCSYSVSDLSRGTQRNVLFMMCGCICSMDACMLDLKLCALPNSFLIQTLSYTLWAQGTLGRPTLRMMGSRGNGELYRNMDSLNGSSSGARTVCFSNASCLVCMYSPKGRISLLGIWLGFLKLFAVCRIFELVLFRLIYVCSIFNINS
jgi:hypothetical protein